MWHRIKNQWLPTEGISKFPLPLPGISECSESQETQY